MRSRERTTSYNQQLLTSGWSGLSNFLRVEQSFITWMSDVVCLQRAHCESSYPSFSLINASEIGNPGISLISVGRKEVAAQRDHGILSVSTDWLIRCWSPKLNFSRTRVWPHTFLRNLQPQQVGSNFNFCGLLETSGQISCLGLRVKGWRQRVQVSKFLLSRSDFYCDSICLTTVLMCVALKPLSLKTIDGALIVYREWNRFWGYMET